MALAKAKPRKSEDAYRSIGEAAGELGLQTHVLRYWETKFPAYLKPVKRRDGRRFYRPEDVSSARAIQHLVHTRGMTLKGALNLLDEQGVETVLNGDATLAPATPVASPAKALQDSVRDAFEPDAPKMHSERLRGMLAEMNALKAKLDEARERSVA
ncbi:MAG: MerR family transcriptional regulator [Pseudomonadota bacterium]